MNTYKASIPHLAATQQLAQSLAQYISKHWQEHQELPVRALLFKGDLGSGKTTFTRCFVQALPQGDMAEVSSPSFTLCNVYKTIPTVLHADLYRCGASLPDEVWEALDNSDTLSLIEWSEHLPQEALPEDYLDISLKICEECRLIEVIAFGPKAEMLLKQWPDV